MSLMGNVTVHTEFVQVSDGVVDLVSGEGATRCLPGRVLDVVSLVQYHYLALQTDVHL